jgi:hypothetical protein
MLPSKEDQIEALAMEARTRWGLIYQRCPCVLTCVFKLKNEGLISGYHRVKDEYLPDDEAQYDPHLRVLRLRESVFCAANDFLSSSTARRRARFTVMHEIGHVLRGHSRVRHRNISNRKIEKIVMQTQVDESEADRFASAFLVPVHLVDINRSPTARDISEEFLISIRAAEIRLEELTRLHRRKNNIKRDTPDFVRDYLLEAKSRGVDVKSLD